MIKYIFMITLTWHDPANSMDSLFACTNNKVDAYADDPDAGSLCVKPPHRGEVVSKQPGMRSLVFVMIMILYLILANRNHRYFTPDHEAKKIKVRKNKSTCLGLVAEFTSYMDGCSSNAPRQVAEQDAEINQTEEQRQTAECNTDNGQVVSEEVVVQQDPVKRHK